METANAQCNIRVLEKHSNYVWVRGTTGRYWFDAKVYHVGSKRGISKGRINKLLVWINTYKQGRSRWIATYDRGWDIQPDKNHRKSVEHIIGLLEALPPPEALVPSRKENPC